jgi:hypothetical protein
LLYHDNITNAYRASTPKITNEAQCARLPQGTPSVRAL